MFDTNRKLTESLISKQIPGNQKPLNNALKFRLRTQMGIVLSMFSK